MAYEISWYRENRVMRMTLTGQLTKEEFEMMEAEAFEIIKNAQWVLHAIVDMSGIDENSGNLRNVFGGKREKHPNQGISVVVLPKLGKISKFITSTAMQVLGLQFRLTDSIDEAYAIIDKFDVRSESA